MSVGAFASCVSGEGEVLGVVIWDWERLGPPDGRNASPVAVVLVLPVD